jgi:hypothetical protein
LFTVRASIGYLLCALMDGELAGTPFRPLRLHRIYRLRVERHDDRVKLTRWLGLDQALSLDCGDRPEDPQDPVRHRWRGRGARGG